MDASSSISLLLRFLRSVLVIVLSVSITICQSSLKGWGESCTDTDAREGQFVHVAAGDATSAVVREDGRIICQGFNGPFGNCDSFPVYPGLRYLKVAMGGYFTLGLLSNGAVEALGSFDFVGLPVPVPALPPGIRYVDIEAGHTHALLLRSDGVVIGLGESADGQCNVPAFPAGSRPVQMAPGNGHSLILLSDGSVVAFGRNDFGQCNVPTLPPGMAFTEIDANGSTSLAIRSDGTLMVWGEDRFGHTVVPPGRYTKAALGGGHTVAWRTDGVFVVFGDGSSQQHDAPSVPQGTGCKQLAGGGLHTIALMTDGSVLSWGHNTYHQSMIPSIPDDPERGGRATLKSIAAGGPYYACVLSDGTLRLWGHEFLSSMPLPFPNKNFKRIELGWGTAVAMTEDGDLLAWGDNSYGKATVPPLPPGVRYVDYDECWSHTVAIRSDGEAVQFGSYVGSIPPLPPGMRYVDADAEDHGSMLLRSDGTVFVLAAGSPRMYTVPPAGAGLSYVQVAHCAIFAGALRNDGTLALWGEGVTGQSAVWRALPPLPPGVVYVEISGGYYCIAARRSDGQVVAGGWTRNRREHVVPPLQPGTSYVEVDGGDEAVAARVGPTSTYISFYQGCSGSRPATRVIPADTPRIGNTLEVRLFDLPTDIAFVALGFARTAPIALDFAGMPGCEAHISLDQITFAAGQGGVATIGVPIPDRRALIGARFYHQAFVLDPAAGNAAGAVVSAAAEAVVGDW